MSAADKGIFLLISEYILRMFFTISDTDQKENIYFVSAINNRKGANMQYFSQPDNSIINLNNSNQ